MREYTKKPENQSRTLDSNPKASRQASISDILQTYKNRALGIQTVQRESIEDEDMLQGRFSDTVQYKDLQLDEDEEPLQGKFQFMPTTEQESILQKKPNNTGLPNDLKTGIESFSGYSIDDVKVHYNSPKPAQLKALAYTQGGNIHIAPGQEKHLPHEAWHVIQQKQGRVQPTTQLQGVNVNNDDALEREADEIGETVQNYSIYPNFDLPGKEQVLSGGTIQMVGEKKFTIANSEGDNDEYKQLDGKIKRVKEERKIGKQEFIINKLGDEGALHFFKLKLKQLNEKTYTSLNEKEEYQLNKKKLSELTNAKEIEKEIKNFAMDTYPESLKFNIIEKLKPDYAFIHDGAPLDSIDKLDDKAYVLSVSDQKFATLLVGSSAFTSKKERVEREIYNRDDKEYIKDDKGVFTRRYAYVEKNLYQFMDFLNMGKMIGRYELLNVALGVEGNALRERNRALTEDGKKRLLTDPEQLIDKSTAIAVQHQWMGTGLQQRGLSLASTPKEAVISNDGDSFRSDDGVRIKIDLAKIPEYKDEDGKKDNPMLINHYAYGGIKDRAEGIKPSVLKNEQPVEPDKMRYHYVNSVTKNRELFLEFLKPEWIEEVTFHGKTGKKETVTLEQFITKCKEIINYTEYEEGVHNKIKPEQDDLISPPKEKEKGQGYGELYNNGYTKGSLIRKHCDFQLDNTEIEKETNIEVFKLMNSIRKAKLTNTINKGVRKSLFNVLTKLAADKYSGNVKVTQHVELLRLLFFNYYAIGDEADVERIGFAHGLMNGVKKNIFNEDFYKLSFP